MTKTAKGATPTKATATKTSARKAAGAKATKKKPAATKATAKKGAARKPAATKATTKKAPAKKPTARKAPAKKGAAKRAPAAKATTRKAPARKPAARKAAARKAVAKKPAVRRAAPAKAPKRPAKAVGDGSLASVLEELATLTDASTRAPATAAELAKVERILGTIPTELAALYGFAGNVAATFGEAGGGLSWLDVADAARAGKANREHGVPAGLFPIATDEAGQYSLFDCDSGRIMSWDHGTREATPLTATLATYLTKHVLPGLRRGAKKQATGATP